MVTRIEKLVLFVAVLILFCSSNIWAATLLHHYSCNEGTGTVVGDSAGAVDGTIGGPGGAQWVPGVTGYALAFDGAGYVVVADSSNDGSFDLINAGTLMAWVRTSSASNTEGRLFQKGNDSDGLSYLVLDALDHPAWAKGLYTEFASGPRLTLPGYPPADGQWHHIAVSWDSGNQKIYINGVEQASGGGTAGNSNAGLFSFGGDYTQGVHSRQFKGIMDEIRIYDDFMDATEVAAVKGTAPVVTGGFPEYYGVVNLPRINNASDTRAYKMTLTQPHKIVGQSGGRPLVWDSSKANLWDPNCIVELSVPDGWPFNAQACHITSTGTYASGLGESDLFNPTTMAFETLALRWDYNSGTGQWTVKNLGYFPDGTPSYKAEWVNGSGWCAINGGPYNKAGVFDPVQDMIVELPYPSSITNKGEAMAACINEAGDIVVGMTQDADDGAWIGCIWTKSGGVWSVATLTTPGGRNSCGLLIDSANNIYGQAQLTDGTWAMVKWPAAGGSPEVLTSGVRAWIKEINSSNQLALNQGLYDPANGFYSVDSILSNNSFLAENGYTDGGLFYVQGIANDGRVCGFGRQSSDYSWTAWYMVTAPEVCGEPGTVYLPMDFNEDCKVDIEDFAEFAAGWLQCTDPALSSCDQYWK